jgi:capsular exopolysaccharide synthesis family protein
MSRIEEALQRASVPLGPRDVAIVRESAALAAGEATLTQYPEEFAGQSERPRRVAQLDRPIVRKPAPASGRTQGRLGPFPSSVDGKLILGNNTAPVAVEQYRRLAGTLHDLQAAQGTKVLMVTSAVPREGKTLTVCNLALTLSESYGRRVLLIDADLRRPAVHEVFGISNATGLSDGLRSDASELSLIQLSPHLTVLPAGRPESNPMAGLTSERMRALLEESARAFDWVLLDAPPVGIMPDANLVARLTQGVIYVLAAGSTPHTLVERAVNEIGRESIVGVVLNRIAPGTIPATEYYEQYYQSAD